MNINLKQFKIDTTSLYYATFEELHKDLAELKSHLSNDETIRAEKYKTEELSNNWTLCRGLLKTLLANHLNISPNDIELKLTEHGKPILADTESPYFNISHSNSAVLIGISPEGPIGVDLETIRTVEDAYGVAQQFFSKRESEFIANLNEPHRSKTFLELWTLKEAYLKALGTGIKTPPSEIDLDCKQLSNQPFHYLGFTLHRVAINSSCTAVLCAKQDKTYTHYK